MTKPKYYPLIVDNLFSKQYYLKTTQTFQSFNTQE